jgi:hypothetical protein
VSRIRERFARAVLYVGFSLSPARAPLWRLDPAPPPAPMLAVGLPVRRLVPSDGHSPH